MQRSQLQQRYGVLFQALNLTPVQRDKFKDIIAAKVARETDISAAATAQALEFNDPVIKKLSDDSQKQMKTELLAELGEKNFEAYQEFERTTAVRGFVGGFAVQMAMTEPLTPTQAEQLAKALIDATPAAETGRNVDPGKVNWSMVDRMAEQFLSPTQLAAWELGAAHNPAGGSRLDHELKKAYDTALANTQKKPGS
jgi:Spy/CpxP family protein refolding chaperone